MKVSELRCAFIAASENMSHKLRTRWKDYVQRYDSKLRKERSRLIKQITLLSEQ